MQSMSVLAREDLLVVCLRPLVGRSLNLGFWRPIPYQSGQNLLSPERSIESLGLRTYAPKHLCLYLPEE